MTPSKQYWRIWQAVRHRELLSFSYRRKRREAQPVVLGYASEDREALMAY